MSDKKWFVLRVILWNIFGWVVPIAFIIYRFNLFQKVSQINLNGGIILCAIIFFIFLIVLLSYIIKSKKYSYMKQILKGVIFLIIPLALVFICLYYARNMVDRLLQVVGCLLISETIAICVNPMEAWTYEQSKGEEENFINYVLAKREEKKNDNK